MRLRLSSQALIVIACVMTIATAQNDSSDIAPSSAAPSATASFSPSSTRPLPARSTVSAVPTSFGAIASSTPDRALSTRSPTLYTSYSVESTTSYATSSPSPTPTPTTAGHVPDIDLLPITPQITPAFAIAGFILIISGLVLGLIGIRAKRLHIFLSSAYLVALAVTVLVIYVATPPVSDGVQAAYFVAALLSGCAVGAISLIFTDITQGLGCAVGGFCLAMWLLILKAGGLVTSTGGRAGLIAAFTLAAFGLSFSHYTRTYGLLVCMAFGGATAVVLGIDCYSRAGLKEFWMYIWDLNSALFPLNTSTYPLTRGIKVEIVAIIIIFICGVISQMKLFKLVQERLDKKVVKRTKDEKDREHLEADLGRRIEDTTMRERELWERKYSEFDKGHVSAAASVVGSEYPPTTASRAQSVKDMTMNVREVTSPDADAMEMSTLPSRSDDKKGAYTVYVRSINDEHTERPGYAMPGTSSQHLQRITEYPSRASSVRSSPASEQHAFKRMSLQPSAPPPPVVIPLPFTVTEEDTRIDDDDMQSCVAIAETTASTKTPKALKRKSTRTVESATFDDYGSDSRSDIIVPHIEDDRASSLAATFDELTDDEHDKLSLPAMSRSSSPRRWPVTAKSLRETPVRRAGSTSQLSKPPSLSASLADSAVSGVKPRRRKSDTPKSALVQLLLDGPDDKAPEDLADVLQLKTAQRANRLSQDSALSGTQSPQSSSGVISMTAVKTAKPLSKAGLKERTHEWTKFLEAADKPEVEELHPTEDGIQVERHTPIAEKPRRVDVEDLARNISLNSANPYRNMKRQSSVPMKPIYASQVSAGGLRSASNSTQGGGSASHMPGPSQRGSMSQQRASSSPVVQTQSLRSPAAPFQDQQLVESPIKNQYDAAFAGRSLPIHGASLMTMRDDMMFRKKTSMVKPNRSFARSNTTPSTNYSDTNMMRNTSNASNTNMINYSTNTFHDNASVHSLNHPDADNISLSSRKNMLNQDDMPLSRRKTLMQQGVLEQQARSRPVLSKRHSGGSQQSGWASQSYAAPQQNFSSLIYDSHQPRRGPSVDQYTQQARLASFRDSLRRDTRSSARTTQAAAENEGHRIAMMNQQQHYQAQALQKQYERTVMDNATDQAMRSGEMLETHKELLRKMQRRASQQG